MITNPFIELVHGFTPQRQTVGSVGYDIKACIDDKVILKSGEFLTINSGFKLMLPESFEGQIRPRSGLARRHGVTVLNAPGTIDNDYTGEVKIILINHGKVDYEIYRGDRIAQLVFHKVEFIKHDLVTRLRGNGGLGFTGYS